MLSPILFLSVPFFLRIVVAFNCSVLPVYVDIHKRAVRGSNVFQYGSFIGAGIPAQNQSLWPSLSQNDTVLADPNFCKGSSAGNCQVTTGGFYDITQSRTWTDDGSYQSRDAGDFSNTTETGQELLHLYTHFFETDPANETNLNGMSLAVAKEGGRKPGVVGMGPSSTLLQKLFDSGLIAGRTYSLYIGSGFDRAGGLVNGSNVFGGYDAGRFTGKVHSYPMKLDSADVLAVGISDIRLDDPTGPLRNVSLFDRARFPRTTSQGFQARITTDQYPMTFPSDITSNFASALAAVQANSPDGSLALQKPFNGTMTITLSDGFTVTLPPEVMFNASGLTPVAPGPSSQGGTFYLGSSFLSQVYLMLDYESYTFHMARAIAKNAYVQPRTWCPKTVPVPMAKPQFSAFSKAGGVGAVVGGVIGGIAGLALAFFCFRVFYAKYLAAKGRKEEEAHERKLKSFEFGFEEGSVGSDDGKTANDSGWKGGKWNWRMAS